MATKIRHDVYEFLCACLRNKPADVPAHQSVDDIANRMMQLARTAQRYNLLRCNVGLTPAQDRRSQRVDEKFLRLCQEWGWEGKIGSDPRGFALKIVFPDGSSNNWPGDGWGVPE